MINSAKMVSPTVVLTPELFRSMLAAVRDEQARGRCRTCGAGPGQDCKTKRVPKKKKGK